MDKSASNYGINNTIIIGITRNSIADAESLIPTIRSQSNWQIILGFEEGYYPEASFFSTLSQATFPLICVEENSSKFENALFYPPKGSCLGFEENNKSLIRKNCADLDSFFYGWGEIPSENIICILLNSKKSKQGQEGLYFMKNCGAVTFSLFFTSRDKSRPDYIIPSQEIINILNSGIKEIDSFDFKEKYQDIINEISSFSKIDFSCYKEDTLKRRIRKRMMASSRFSLSAYYKLLKEDDEEKKLLLSDCLIGVTYFFRDSEIFHKIRDKILPEICRDKEQDDELRIWTAGCSSGEEAYSLAILMEELNKTRDSAVSYKIFATDVDLINLEKAKAGVYTQDELQAMKSEWLEKYFTALPENLYKIKDNIRTNLIFSCHNLINDPPYLNIDLITCRNMLIYIKQSSQKQIFDNFRFSIKEKGFLILGKSELLNKYRDDFKVISNKEKIYQCISRRKVYPESLGMNHHPFLKRNLLRSSHEEDRNSDDKAKIFTKILFKEFVPPCLIIDSQFDLIFTEGDLSGIIHVSPGSFHPNLFRLIDSEMAVLIRAGIVAAKRDKAKISLRNKSRSGKELNLVIEEISVPYEGSFYKLVFHKDECEAQAQAQTGNMYKVLSGHELKQFEMESLQDELQKTRQELKETIEALESANEELQSSNEELLASNEELQSANESLYTLNNQLNDKNNTLAEINTDQKNLLNNSQIGIIFLDKELKIRKFTSTAKEYFNLIESDKGRELDVFTSCFPLKTKELIINSARNVLESGIPIEKEIQDNSGNDYLLKEHPFLMPTNEVNGVLLTFDNISYIKKIESELHARESEIHTIFESMDTAFAHHEIILDNNGIPCDYQFINVNPAFESLLGLNREDIIGKTVLEILPETENYWIEKYGELAINGIPFDYMNYSKELGRHFRVHAFSPKKYQFSVFIYDVTHEKKLEEWEKEQANKMEFSLKGGDICTWEEVVPEKIIKLSELWYSLIESPQIKDSEQIDNWLKNLLPEDRDLFLQKKNNYLSGKSSEMEVNLRYQSNKGIKWLLCRGKVMEWDEKGNPVRLFGTFTNITRQVKLQEREKENYRKYQLAVKSSGLSLVEYDLKNDRIHFDNHISQIFNVNLSKNDITLKKILDRIADSHREETEKKIDEFLEGRQHNLSLEIPVLCNKERICWIDTVLERIIDEETGDVKRIIGFIRDITNRVEREAVIRQEKEFLEVTQKEAKIGFWDFDIEKDQLHLGMGLRKIWGDIIPETLDRSEIKKYFPPEMEKKFFSNINNAIEEGISSRHFEISFLYEEGKYIYFNGELKIFRNHQNKLEKVSGWLQDNSRLFELENKLNQKAKMESIGQLAGGIAHDFNNQLMGIMGYASLLQESKTEAQRERFTNQIMKAAQHSADLTQKLLLFSRKGKYVSKSIDLNEIVKDALDILKAGLDPGIIIELSEEADNSIISCDPSLLQNSIINLAVNAKEAMSGKGKIIIRTENISLEYHNDLIFPEIPGLINSAVSPYPGDFIRLDVQDFGKGISEENIKHLFEPFYTTKKIGRGAGMGLAAVYGTVEAHKGFIGLKTEKEKGSCISLYFPVTNKYKTNKKKKKKNDELSKNPARILLIDDEPIPLEVTNEMLVSLGYETRMFSSGKEAVDYMRSSGTEEFQLVLVDMIMPEYNGSYVFHETKKINPEQKIMILSGYSETDEIKELLEKGADGFIHKPIKLAELNKAVSSCLKS